MQEEGTNDKQVSRADAIELLRRHLSSGRSRSAPLTLMPAELLPLASHEAMVGIGNEATAAWTLAANLQAPCFVAISQQRAVYFEHMLVLGLFAITAGPQDFFARLTSRSDAKIDDQSTLCSEPSQALLLDTIHHVCRAAEEQVGYRLTEAERAIVFERAWRYAFAPPQPPGFLRDDRTHAALERLCRSGKVELIWGDARTFMVAEQTQKALREREMSLGALAIFDPLGEIQRHATRAPWERLGWSDTSRCYVASNKEQREYSREDLLSRLLEQKPNEAEEKYYDPRLVENTLSHALRDDVFLFELLDEALTSPYPPLLSTLFRRLRDHQDQAGAHPLGPIFELCDSTVLHDDDPSWRGVCNRALAVPIELRARAANAMTHRLGLFEV